jgi:hypothetical protein
VTETIQIHVTYFIMKPLDILLYGVDELSLILLDSSANLWDKDLVESYITTQDELPLGEQKVH